jgi:hypothetical protein
MPCFEAPTTLESVAANDLLTKEIMARHREKDTHHRLDMQTPCGGGTHRGELRAPGEKHYLMISCQNKKN